MVKWAHQIQSNNNLDDSNSCLPFYFLLFCSLLFFVGWCISDIFVSMHRPVVIYLFYNTHILLEFVCREIVSHEDTYPHARFTRFCSHNLLSAYKKRNHNILSWFWKPELRIQQLNKQHSLNMVEGATEACHIYIQCVQIRKQINRNSNDKVFYFWVTTRITETANVTETATASPGGLFDFITLFCLRMTNYTIKWCAFRCRCRMFCVWWDELFNHFVLTCCYYYYLLRIMEFFLFSSYFCLSLLTGFSCVQNFEAFVLSLKQHSFR